LGEDLKDEHFINVGINETLYTHHNGSTNNVNLFPDGKLDLLFLEAGSFVLGGLFTVEDTIRSLLPKPSQVNFMDTDIYPLY
jgi:hypothetical protein